MIIVFDLDGTLVDASEIHAEILSDILGRKIDPQEVYHSSSLRFLLMEKVSKTEWTSLKDLVRQHESRILRAASKARPMEGVYAMLDGLDEKKAVFTSASRELTEAFLNQSYLKEYFDAIVTSDDITSSKPDPEGLFVIADELDDDDMIVVGNSDKDILAAKKFGAKTIFFSPSGMASNVADYSAQSLEEVADLIKSL